MIITCPCENKKKFKIDTSLIPTDGRDLQCGTCGQVWFYKIEKSNPLESKNITENDEVDQIKQEKSNTQSNDIKVNNLSLNENEIKSEDIEINKNIEKKDLKSDTKKSDNKVSKFFSYLIVFLISLIALVILLDTLKKPLINIFPELEFILFNLYETLKDIRLFIIDLS